jgi:hypothetical protein
MNADILAQNSKGTIARVFVLARNQARRQNSRRNFPKHQRHRSRGSRSWYLLRNCFQTPSKVQVDFGPSIRSAAFRIIHARFREVRSAGLASSFGDGHDLAGIDPGFD